MKLVIDIPEHIYKELTETAIIVTEVYPLAIDRALTEGTPYEERKTGKWRDTGSGQECSCCMEIQHGYDNGRRYCQNCGAKMEVDE